MEFIAGLASPRCFCMSATAASIVVSAVAAFAGRLAGRRGASVAPALDVGGAAAATAAGAGLPGNGFNSIPWWA
jgi:hypothetical protein